MLRLGWTRRMARVAASNAFIAGPTVSQVAIGQKPRMPDSTGRCGGPSSGKCFQYRRYDKEVADASWHSTDDALRNVSLVWQLSEDSDDSEEAEDLFTEAIAAVGAASANAISTGGERALVEFHVERCRRYTSGTVQSSQSSSSLARSSAMINALLISRPWMRSKQPKCPDARQTWTARRAHLVKETKSS